MDILNFDEFFARETAAIARTVPPEQGNLYYGRDIWCRLDFSDDFSDVDPKSPEAVGQSVLHRLVTPHGALKKIGGPADHGLGVPTYLHKNMGQHELANLKAAIEHECREDDRVQSASATVVFALEKLTVRVRLTLQDSSQTFDLVFSLDGSGSILEAVVS